jgi:hypothetical protein
MVFIFLDYYKVCVVVFVCSALPPSFFILHPSQNDMAVLFSFPKNTRPLAHFRQIKLPGVPTRTTLTAENSSPCLPNCFGSRYGVSVNDSILFNIIRCDYPTH